MNKAVNIDLADTTDALTHLVELLPTMKLKDKVDACARLRGAAKAIEAFDKSVKDEIKKVLGEQDGKVPGDLFNAVLKYNPTTRLNQKLFKDERPKIYDQYCETNDEARITFEPR